MPQIGIYELRSDGVRSVIFSPSHEDEDGDYIGWMMHSRNDFPRLLETADATSWLEAKRMFGKSLSPLQTRIVEGTATAFEITGRTFGSLAEIFTPTVRSLRQYAPASVLQQAWKTGGLVKG